MAQFVMNDIKFIVFFLIFFMCEVIKFHLI